MYNLPLPILMCHAQALRSETSYCYCCVTESVSRVCPCCLLCLSVTIVSCTVLCGALYTACVDASGMVFLDRSVLR